MNIHTAAAVLTAMMTIGKIIFESISPDCTLHLLMWLYGQTLDFCRLLAMHQIVLENPVLRHVLAVNMVY